MPIGVLRDVCEVGVTGAAVACVVPGGADGVVDGDDVVVADGYLCESKVCISGVPTCGEETFVEVGFATLSNVVCWVGQADDVLAADVLGEGIVITLV